MLIIFYKLKEFVKQEYIAILSKNIGNMDGVLVLFNISAKHTVDIRGLQDVKIL